jgi:hypothetical protein
MRLAGWRLRKLSRVADFFHFDSRHLLARRNLSGA